MKLSTSFFKSQYEKNDLEIVGDLSAPQIGGQGKQEVYSHDGKPTCNGAATCRSTAPICGWSCDCHTETEEDSEVDFSKAFQV